MKILKFGVVLLFSLTLWACSKGNPDAPAAIDPTTGKHVIASWKSPLNHGGVDFGASKDMASCQECHGVDYAGGISKVSCLNTAGCHGVGVESPHPKKPWRGGGVTHTLVKESNAAVCAKCHTKGNNYPGAQLVVSYSSATPGCFNSTLCHDVVGHKNDPQPWAASANHGANPKTAARPGAKFSIQACQSCHATTPVSGLNPVFNLAKTGMSSGCETCHGGPGSGLAHPLGWLPKLGTTSTHASAEDLAASCQLCHIGVITPTTPVGGNAPSCMIGSITLTGGTSACHFTPPVNAQNQSKKCASCHGDATDPNNITFWPSSKPENKKPNRDENHSAHLTSIPGLTCDACHNGYGPANDNPNHSNVGGIANVKISSSFNAAGSNPITIPNATTAGCSNVSCHGNADLPTPVWGASNAFDIYAPGAVNCTKCHLLIGATAAENAAQSSYLEVYNGDNLSGADGSFYGYGSSFNLHWAHRTEAAALTLNGEILCTNCHSGTRMQQQNFHFAQLVNGGKSLTKLAKGAAAATVGDAVDATDTLITSYSYGASAPRGTCTPKSGYGCHSFSSSLTRNWFK